MVSKKFYKNLIFFEKVLGSKEKCPIFALTKTKQVL